MRYFLELSYFGKSYSGWQKQPNANSVQEVLEHAMQTLLRTAITLVGAGRTDAGVHCKQMFAHFDVQTPIDIRLKDKLNAYLPEDIAVVDIHRVRDDAHARYDAILREYQYYITLAKNPFLKNSAYYYRVPLDVSKMNVAAQKLLGYQDFKCFSKSKTFVKTYFCEVFCAYWQRQEDTLIFTVSANRFLRNMVRAIVGTLLDVGMGKIPPEAITDIVKQRDRSFAGVSAPAQGLYLLKVEYPKETFILK